MTPKEGPELDSCEGVSAQISLLRELAPSGRLRVGINLGNPVLAVQTIDEAEPFGISVDLANELGRRLGVRLELVTFESAGKVVEAVKVGQLDLVFLAIDPGRAKHIAYSKPYLVIDGCFLVRADSELQSIDEVDRPGHRVVVGAASAYDLHLSRWLRSAQIVRAPTSDAVVDVMVASGCDVAAGVRQQLERDQARRGGLRLLPGRFMCIEQAMGVPADRPAAARFVASFVEGIKASGFITTALARHGIDGVTPSGL